MSEAELTTTLLDNLQRGDLKKIARTENKKIHLRREIGNNSFRADIFITLQKDEELVMNSKTSFIAIEVKIKDWKQGFYQAWRYNSFAEKSYLALYEPYSKNIDLNLFKDNNVGLIIFNEKTITIKNHPKRNTFTRNNLYSKNLRIKIWNSLGTIESIEPIFQK